MCDDIPMDAWMGACRETLAPQRLVDVRFPGTHNSFSRFAGSGPARRIAANQATCVDEQLAMGVRFFDCRLRVADGGVTTKTDGGPSSSMPITKKRVIRTYHGSEAVGGNSDDFFPILAKIGKFLRGRPEARSHEVVIMSISHLEKFTDADKDRLRTQILETFGALLMPHPGHGQALAGMTLAEIWATPHRVIVLLDDCQPPPQQQHGGGPLLWSGELYHASYRSNWPDKNTTSDLMFANESILGTGIRCNPQWIQVLQCQLTPSREDAAAMPLNGGSRRIAAFTNAWYKAFFRRPVDAGLPWFAEAETGGWSGTILERTSAPTHILPLNPEGSLVYACDANNGRWLVRDVVRPSARSLRFDGGKVWASGEWQRKCPVQVLFRGPAAVGGGTYLYLQSAQAPRSPNPLHMLRDEYPFTLLKFTGVANDPPMFRPVPGGAGHWGRVWDVTLYIKPPSSAAAESGGGGGGGGLLWCYDSKDGSLMIRRLIRSGGGADESSLAIAETEATRGRIDPGCPAQVAFELDGRSFVLMLRRNHTWQIYEVAPDGALRAPTPVSNGALHHRDPPPGHAEILTIGEKLHVLCSRGQHRFRGLFPIETVGSGGGDQQQGPRLTPVLGAPVASGLWPTAGRAYPWPADDDAAFVVASGDDGKPGWLAQYVTTDAPRLNCVIADFVDRDYCHAVISPYTRTSHMPAVGDAAAPPPPPPDDDDEALHTDAAAESNAAPALAEDYSV